MSNDAFNVTQPPCFWLRSAISRYINTAQWSYPKFTQFYPSDVTTAMFLALVFGTLGSREHDLQIYGIAQWLPTWLGAWVRQRAIILCFGLKFGPKQGIEEL